MLVIMPRYDAPEIIWKGETVSNNSEKSKIYKAVPTRVGRDESHYFIEVTLLVTPYHGPSRAN